MRTTRHQCHGKMRSRAPSKPCLRATFLLRFQGGTRHFATTLAPLPLRRTFLREGLRAFLGVPAEEQLIVDAHGERGSC
jgi:hypothetical protein